MRPQEYVEREYAEYVEKNVEKTVEKTHNKNTKRRVVTVLGTCWQGLGLTWSGLRTYCPG